MNSFKICGLPGLGAGRSNFSPMALHAKIDTMGYDAQALENFLLNNPRIELDTIIDALEGVETQVLCTADHLDSKDLHQLSTVHLFRQSLKALK